MSSELLTLFREFICRERQRNEQWSELVLVCGFPLLFESRDWLNGNVHLHLLHSLSVALSLIRHV